MANGGIINLSASHERPAQTFSGYAMLLLLLVAIVAQVISVLGLIGSEGAGPPLAIIGVVVSPIVLLFVLCGF